MRKKSIVNTVFSVSGLILAGKLLGFVKQMYVAAKFGTSIETDLISLAEGFIANTQYLLVQVLLTSFTAVYIHTREQSEREARSFAMDTLKVFSAISALAAVLIMAASKPVARLLAPSYTAELSEQVAFYLRILAPLLVFFVWAAIFHALLNSNERFLPGEMTSVNISWITVAVVFLFAPMMGVKALILAVFAYAVFNAVFLGGFSWKYIGRSSGNPLRNPSVRKLLRMAGPLLFSYSVIYINQQINNMLVSGLEAGTVTAMNYAAVLSNLVNTFIITFCSVLFTYIAAAIAKDEHEKAAEISTYSAILIMVVFLPVSIITILAAEDIVAIVFGRGAFDARSVKTAAAALRGYGFTFVPLALREVYSRVCYGYQDAKRPTISSTVSILVNLVLSIALCPVVGVFGVAFASSVAVMICGILNVVSARKHGKSYGLGALWRMLPPILLGSLLCAAAVQFGLDSLSSIPAIARFLIIAIMGCGSYFVPVGLLLYKSHWKKLITMLKEK